MTLTVSLQSYIRHLKWAHVWPVPTWNLRTPLRQSLQAASVKLPAELSASSEVGATRFAMMGDQSLRKARGEVNTRQGVFRLAARTPCA